MSEERFVVGFKNDPKKMKVVHTTEDKVDEVVKEHGFTTHLVEEDYGYCEYLTIEVYKYDKEYSLDVMQFESKTPAVLNIDLRSETSFLYDIDEGKFVNSGILLWKDRDKAKNSKQATKYVASRLSELFYNIGKKEAEELTEYAERHDVPLSLDMHKEFQKVFKAEHPNWDSSDGRCPW